MRTLIQPFLLVFVFLYVFPSIGQGIGGGHGPAAESDFATVLVPGVVGISIMFQGIQAVAMVLAPEFGYTREIEDRVQAPVPDLAGGGREGALGRDPGLLAALIVFPIAAVIHAPGRGRPPGGPLAGDRHADPARLPDDDLARPGARDPSRPATSV